MNKLNVQQEMSLKRTMTYSARPLVPTSGLKNLSMSEHPGSPEDLGVLAGHGDIPQPITQDRDVYRVQDAADSVVSHIEHKRYSDFEARTIDL